MKIQAAIFDIGNVLLPFDYERAGTRLVAENRPSAPPDRERIKAAHIKHELGQIDRATFLSIVRPEFNHTGPEKDFVAIWEDIFFPNPPMDALVARLSERLPLYLLSNTNCIHRESIHRDYPVFGFFRDAVYSYEVGLMKPDPAIFHLAAKRFGVDPARTLYIDDMPENVEAAKSAGFLAIRYDHRTHAAAEAEILALAE